MFAALATKLLPNLMHRRIPVATLIGFASGVILMLRVKHLVEQFGQKGISTGKNTCSLVLILSIDILLDGILIG